MDNVAPDKKPEAPQPPVEDVLDIDLEDLPEEPAEAPGAVLEVNLDEADEPAGQFPAVEEYPAVTEQQARAAAGVTLTCVCSVKRESFVVAFEELEPGFYFATTAEPCGKGASGPGAGGMSQIQGEFAMGPEFQCPYCHCGGLVVCSGCGTVLCTGAASKQGVCVCPECGSELTLSQEMARSVRGSGGKGKKKGI